MTLAHADTPASTIQVAESNVAASSLLNRLDDVFYKASVEAFESLGVIYKICSPGRSYQARAFWLTEAEHELERLIEEQGEEYQVATATINHALRLLSSLPQNSPKPEIAIDPDGQIAIEWQRAKRWVLSATIDEQSTVYFAALLGPNRYRGAERFERILPIGLAENLERFESTKTGTDIGTNNWS